MHCTKCCTWIILFNLHNFPMSSAVIVTHPLRQYSEARKEFEYEVGRTR